MHFFHTVRATGMAAALTLACLTGWSSDLAQGEIRKIDKAQGKITIKHGDIPSIQMPPMTMVFIVRERALLDAAKVGDKIRFDAVDEAGKLIVTRIEAEQ